MGDSGDKERTIVSYPVKWSEETRQFMIEAARKAGFPDVTGMDEAQAAIQAVTVMSEDHLHKNGLLVNGEPCNILLIDMGAGTTDLVLCRYTPGEKAKAEILSTWPKDGEILFGGREVDSLLQGYFRNMMDEESANLVFRRVGLDKFKTWKENTVSPALEKNDSVTDFEPLDNQIEGNDIDMDEYCLDRAAFEDCLSDYLKQLPKLISGCIVNSSIDGADVDLVIVTGGHSQWYFVQEMLTGEIPQFGDVDMPNIKDAPSQIISISRPQETVALGLAFDKIKVHIQKKEGKDQWGAQVQLVSDLEVIKQQDKAADPKNATIAIHNAVLDNREKADKALSNEKTTDINQDELKKLAEQGWNIRHSSFDSEITEKGNAMILEAAEKGYAHAQYWVGEDYEDGDYFGISKGRKDAVTAFSWYLKAAEQGDESAQLAVSRFYFNGIGMPRKNYELGMYWVQRAASQNIRLAQLCIDGLKILDSSRLSGEKLHEYGYAWYSVGEYTKAIDLLQKSAKLGNADSQHWLGRMYQLGRGVSEDKNLAKYWYKKAAAQGHKDAIKDLVDLGIVGKIKEK